jgi:hypothetical protein
MRVTFATRQGSHFADALLDATRLTHSHRARCSTRRAQGREDIFSAAYHAKPCSDAHRRFFPQGFLTSVAAKPHISGRTADCTLSLSLSPPPPQSLSPLGHSPQEKLFSCPVQRGLKHYLTNLTNTSHRCMTSSWPRVTTFWSETLALS